MKTIKIELPEGFEFDSFNEQNLELKLKEKKLSVFDRIKTFEDVLKDNKCGAHFINWAYEHGIELSKDEIAYRKLKLIAKSLNKGHFITGNPQNKYYPTFKFDDGSLIPIGSTTSTIMGVHIGFNTHDLAVHAGTQFTDIYRDFIVKRYEL